MVIHRNVIFEGLNLYWIEMRFDADQVCRPHKNSIAVSNYYIILSFSFKRNSDCCVKLLSVLLITVTTKSQAPPKPEMICSMGLALTLPSFSNSLAVVIRFLWPIWGLFALSSSTPGHVLTCLPLSAIISMSGPLQWSSGHVLGMGVAGLSMSCRCEERLRMLNG